MPKGGDLHNHLTGTIYAESYLGWAAEDGKCWDITQKAIVPGPCVGDMIAFSDIYPGGRLTPRLTVDPIIDMISTRNFRLREESAIISSFQPFHDCRRPQSDGGERCWLKRPIVQAGKTFYTWSLCKAAECEAALHGKANADLSAELGQRVNHVELDAIVANVLTQIDAMEARQIS